MSAECQRIEDRHPFILSNTGSIWQSNSMHSVQVYAISLTDFNQLTIEAGTNCPKGGDAGHGGRTILRIIDDGSTSMTVKIDGKEFENPEKVEIVLYGDAEASTFIEGLEFAVRTLRGQRGAGHRHDSARTESID